MRYETRHIIYCETGRHTHMHFIPAHTNYITCYGLCLSPRLHLLPLLAVDALPNCLKSFWHSTLNISLDSVDWHSRFHHFTSHLQSHLHQKWNWSVGSPILCHRFTGKATVQAKTKTKQKPSPQCTKTKKLNTYKSINFNWNKQPRMFRQKMTKLQTSTEKY